VSNVEKIFLRLKGKIGFPITQQYHFLAAGIIRNRFQVFVASSVKTKINGGFISF
jgi:hypothetical protein